MVKLKGNSATQALYADEENTLCWVARPRSRPRYNDQNDANKRAVKCAEREKKVKHRLNERGSGNGGSVRGAHVFQEMTSNPPSPVVYNADRTEVDFACLLHVSWSFWTWKLRDGGWPLDENLQPTPASETPKTGSARSLTFKLAAVALTIVSALAGTGLAKWLRTPPSATGTTTNPGAEGKAARQFPGRTFLDWNKPDLVLILTGQQNGYMLPCGCSRPQYGGLERRYNLLQMIKKAGWPYAAVDLGDIAQKQGIAGLPNQQGLIKWIYSMKALKEMDYTAVSFGENEVTLGLPSLLDEYALNEEKPRVIVGNLIDADKNFPTMTETWKGVTPPKSDITVGITAAVGQAMQDKFKELTREDKKFTFERTPVALDRVLKDMAAKNVHLPVLLYQGPMTRSGGKKPYTEAMACAEAYPQFPIIVCLSEEDDPPARPIEITTRAGTKNLVFMLGMKGRFIGVVGVWKTGKKDKPFEFKHERIELGEEFMTPADKEKGHPVVELIEAYTRELKDKDYLKKYGQVRHSLQVLPKVPGLKKDVAVTYAGSEACKKCHDHAYDVWKKSPHSHAYKTLVDATRPGNRQFDPECIVCHTVGFGYVSGYVNEKETPKLKDVGCESCHGPCNVHVLNPNDTEWHKRINPWKYLPANKRENAIDQFCQKCHDIDNDVTWIHGGFKKKWPVIDHPTPKGN